MPKVGILMGSISDLDIVRKSVEVLKEFGIEVETRVLSAHRTPYEAAEYARTAEERGVEVIIAAAGKAAHLPGVLAAYTVLPVIGLPIKSSMMDGLDSLLSIVQMPAGIPVATVAVNGSENAALLAVHILAMRYPHLADRLKEYRRSMAERVHQQDSKLQEEIL
ncbi:MAG: 5-(carboxyamino)imidazole ribonucleotide mutase [Clostridiales bacterium]|nr:5-(carboxyamino)imidazole ribonucleotide mutase [Clostridiales bacterium]